jgi:hypothetical protein
MLHNILFVIRLGLLLFYFIYSVIMALYNIIIPHNIKSNDSINGSISFFKPIIKFWKRQLIYEC